MPDQMIQIERKGIPFTVVDTTITAWWRYWHLFENGTWEAPVLATLDRLLPVGGTLLDIGAWVGPVTLWAARHANAHVVALEPDPEAYRQLVENIKENGLTGQVEAINAAASVAVGVVSLWSVDDHWGESTSSMTLRNGIELKVPAVDIAAVVRSIGPALSLVKCDIEGGETTIMPVLGPLLREMRVPLLLSVHPGRYDEAGIPALNAEIAQWKVTQLDPPVGDSLLLEPA